MERLYLREEYAIQHALEITKLAVENGLFSEKETSEALAIEISDFYHKLRIELQK